MTIYIGLWRHHHLHYHRVVPAKYKESKKTEGRNNQNSNTPQAYYTT